MRDVSKILSEAEIVKLRAMLANSPIPSVEEQEFQEYPKILYHKDWLTCWLLIRQNQDPLIVKEAKEKIRHFLAVVHDIETEEDYLLEGWKNDPNDFIVARNIKEGKQHPDPRVPLGREARRTRAQEKLTREQEIRELRRRYAELTGNPLNETALEMQPPAVADGWATDASRIPDGAVVEIADAPDPRRPAPRATKPVNNRDRVKAATARATGARA